MKAYQITLEDWKNNEVRDSLTLFELPFSVLEVKELLGLSFDEYAER
ncbi:hypothetical protein [Candidatus Albibeggiatoa sp. nov. BB20]